MLLLEEPFVGGSDFILLDSSLSQRYDIADGGR